jgi:hypothetical protein
LVIFVEGPSDVASLRALAAARGLDEAQHEFQLVSMGGVTNIRHHLSRLATEHPSARPAGLCDGPEERFFARALRDQGHQVESRQDMERLGFFVCERDLEEEVIRALGPETAEGILADLRLLGRFRTFQRQPEWRDRSLDEQLRRFTGVASGRKVLLAQRFAEVLTPATTPRPLASLLRLIESHEPAGEWARRARTGRRAEHVSRRGAPELEGVPSASWPPTSTEGSSVVWAGGGSSPAARRAR